MYDGSRQHALLAYKFTGKERDAESGLDDFGARYYSSQLGRFVSADWSAVPEPVPYASFTNPQTLNLYAIVHDNPETFADLDGHDDDMPFYSKIDAMNMGESPFAATSGTSSQTAQSSQSEKVEVADDYNVDTHAHGGPHIDRVDDNDKLVGRYDEQGNGIRHKGQDPPKIPRRDQKKFNKAADKLREYKERVKKANQNQQKAPDPAQAPSKYQGAPGLCAGGPCDGAPYFAPLPMGPLQLPVPSFGAIDTFVFAPA